MAKVLNNLETPGFLH